MTENQISYMYIRHSRSKGNHEIGVGFHSSYFSSLNTITPTAGWRVVSKDTGASKLKILPTPNNARALMHFDSGQAEQIPGTRLLACPLAATALPSRPRGTRMPHERVGGNFVLALITHVKP